MIYGYKIITYLMILLIGYSIGRRIGIKEANKNAISYAIVELKANYYKNKECPICSNNRIFLSK